MAAADAVGKKSAFRRGLNATRLALAFAVTVVIVTVVIYAVDVLLRPNKLKLWVVGGIIYVNRGPVANPPEIGLTFSVQANNPSGRVRFYYTDINGSILLNNGTTYSVILARFPLGKPPDMDVAPVSMLQTDANVDAVYYEKISPYLHELYNDNSSSIISDAMLKLNGTLTVGLYSVYNKTSDHPAVYYCWPLTMGAVGNTSADAADNIPCMTYDPKK